MRTQFPGLIRVVLPLFALSLPFAISGRAQLISAPPRITQAVDPQQMLVLGGNTHPLARPEYDRGAVSDAIPMTRILLLLQRSPEQEQALQQLLEQQQSKSSPSYHSWLTPQQFGQQFGPADADIQTLTQWLSSQGFSQIKVGPGRNIIEFSGTAGQVRNAFHTEIHRFVIDGLEYTANDADPQIPSALAPIVTGIVSLHNFPKKSHAKALGQFRHTLGKPGLQPLFTFPNPFGSGNIYGLGPGDFAVIYNTKPLLATANDGTGQTIAVVGETNIKVQDVQQFRAMFGLPANFDATNIILNGEDPGITSVDEEAEADLDVQWSGAVAPGATIKFVVSASTPTSAGIDLSALYIVENNLAPVMSESYGACEKVLGGAGNAFYNNLWEQAAAQGITVIVSSGDGGSAGCDDFNAQQVATQGLAVSGLASTPYNVSLGGTDFDQVNNWAAYWNPTNDATGTSAKSYIPETPWNENCAQIGLNGCGASAPQGSVNIVAGSGGPSSLYTKPKWQLGVAGMPNDNRRDQPDISLLASSGFNGTAYIYCQSDHTISGSPVCNLNVGIVDFGLVGGTSAAAPAFAGIMALVNQKQAALGNSPRQGNANNILYALANKAGASCASGIAEAAGCIFNDVARGNSVLPTGQSGVPTNSVPCQGGSFNCSVSVAGANGVLVDPAHITTEAWTATAGYDMTTGLGSVNVNSLSAAWGTASGIGTTTTLTLSPTTGIKHGSAENVVVNITVKPNTGSGIPAGDVSLIASFVGPPPTTQGLDHFTLGSTGTVANATTQSLPGGTYNVTAHYAGDGINAPSDSPALQVTVSQESSQTFIVVPTFDSQGNLTNGNATNMAYGTPAIIRMYVTNASATANPSGPPSPLCAQVNQMTCPSGTVAITDSGSPVGTGTYVLNNGGYTRDLQPLLTGGTHNLVAQYAGDSSYKASTSLTDTVTITPAPSQNQISAPQGEIIGQGVHLQATVTIPVYRGVAATGSFTFYDGTSVLPGQVTTTAFAGNATTYPTIGGYITTDFSSPGVRSVTATYSGDVNYAPSTSSVTHVDAEYPVTVNVSVTPSTVLYGTPVNIIATVTANHSAPPLTGNIGLPLGISGTPTLTTDSSGNQILTLAGSATPQTSQAITASFYGGDPNYASTTATTFVTVNIPDFTISVPATPLVITAGQSGTMQISIVPATNNSSPVTLVCDVNRSLPTGYTCNVNPQIVNLANGSTATATLTVSPAPSGQIIRSSAFARKRVAVSPSGTSPFRSNPFWQASMVTGLVSIALLLSPRRRKLLRSALVLAIACFIGAIVGCGGGGVSSTLGGGGGSGSGGGGTPGPFATTTTVSTSSAKIAQGTSLTLTARVAGQGNPTGMVGFFLGTWSDEVNLIAGSATATTSPTYPGIFAVTATYNGDASNGGSTSPPVTQFVTGSTVMQVTASTSTLYHSANVTVTLQ
jgi:Pro-kumamolisin, activation domain/Bacterial Ig-like domain (group 3)